MLPSLYIQVPGLLDLSAVMKLMTMSTLLLHCIGPMHLLAGYEAIHAADIPGTLLQLLSAETDALGGKCVYEGILECVLSMCCQPLLALHVSQRPEALQICATR